MTTSKFLVSIAALCFSAAVCAQTLFTLKACYEKAQTHYPLVQQYDLLEQAKKFSIENAGKGKLPQFALSARATHQSDVTSIPAQLPGVEPMNKSQYQVVAEVSQNLWDGGMISSRQRVIEASSDVEEKKIEVDLYVLKDRVNQLFFSVLLLDEYLVQNELLQDNLRVHRGKVEAYKAGGMANQSDVDAISVEQVKARQKKTELLYTRTAYRDMLSVLIGEDIHEEDELVRPSPSAFPVLMAPSNRPELKWFESRAQYFDSQEDVVLATNRPKISLFFQGGAGNPGLNMLENKFSPFYIAGARFSWNLGGLYTQRGDLSNLRINKEMVDVQQQIFEFNNQLEVRQQSSEISQLREQMKNDDEIVALRRNIREASELKLEHGTLSVSDLVRDIHAENQAIQERAQHGVQLLMAMYHLQYIVNN